MVFGLKKNGNIEKNKTTNSKLTKIDVKGLCSGQSWKQWTKVIRFNHRHMFQQHLLVVGGWATLLWNICTIQTGHVHNFLGLNIPKQIFETTEA